MQENIGDFVVDKDIKCPKCGGEMKKSSSINGKSHFKCEKCGHTI